MVNIDLPRLHRLGEPKPPKPEPLENPTWGDLVRIEPKLITLLDAAKAERRRKKRPPVACAWGRNGGFKDIMSDLVGWRCRNPLLKSEAAFCLAQIVLLDALGLEKRPRPKKQKG